MSGSQSKSMRRIAPTFAVSVAMLAGCVFLASSTGSYAIDKGPVGNPDTLTGAEGWLGKKEVAGERATLGDRVRYVNGAKIVRIDIPVKQVERQPPFGPRSSIAPGMVWSTDQESFFALTRDGTLYRIRVPSLQESDKLVIGKNCTRLAKSKAGLVVVSDELQEIWVIDEETLTVQRKISLGNVLDQGTDPVDILTSPEIATGHVRIAPTGGKVDGSEFWVVDLRRGRVVNRLRYFAELSNKALTSGQVKVPKNSWKNVVFYTLEFQVCAMSPDGKYIISNDRKELQRVRVRGNAFTYEEVSANIFTDGETELTFSSDSNYLAISGHHTEIVRVHDLQQPIVKLDSRLPGFSTKPAAGFAFDNRARQFYVGGDNALLSTWSPQGLPLKTYGFRGNGECTYQLLCHPDGFKLVAYSDTGLWWVELQPADPNYTEPIEVGKSIVRSTASDNGATFTQLDIEHGHEFTWSSNGDALYVLEPETGSLRRISMPDHMETHRIDLDTPVSDLCWTARGLVAVTPRRTEFLLLDPATLKILAVLPSGGADVLHSARASDLAFATMKSDTISVIDLAKKQIVENYAHSLVQPPEHVRAALESNRPGVGPLQFDHQGRYVLRTYRDGLCRYQAEGSKLAFEEYATIWPSRLEFSAAPGFVLVSGEVRNAPDRAEPAPWVGEGLFVYRTNDLSKPLFFHHEQDPLAVWSASTRTIVNRMHRGRDFAGHLAAYHLNGKPAGTFTVPVERPQRSREIHVSDLIAPPKGDYLLAIAFKGVWTVKLPAPLATEP